MAEIFSNPLLEALLQYKSGTAPPDNMFVRLEENDNQIRAQCAQLNEARETINRYENRLTYAAWNELLLQQLDRLRAFEPVTIDHDNHSEDLSKLWLALSVFAADTNTYRKVCETLFSPTAAGKWICADVAADRQEDVCAEDCPHELQIQSRLDEGTQLNCFRAFEAHYFVSIPAMDLIRKVEVAN
ncbi:hypothetical protein LZ554_009592 [Drepanopeziza brunnea f. sp. 'monogermtubi']|nr:hypothetical protein LZ554_009592 [Drepanopeziza brunnea f. sp. 'monogermtubi']